MFAGKGGPYGAWNIFNGKMLQELGEAKLCRDIGTAVIRVRRMAPMEA